MERRKRHARTAGLLGVALWMLLAGPAAAQTFVSGSTGADGPLTPPGSVPAGTTVTGSTYTIPLPPSGIFHFTTITIPSGVTVTFARNAANTPVTLLATGAVTITGTIDVSGTPGGVFGRPGPGGPGGFGGGAGSDGGLTSASGSPGLGPGGGGIATYFGGGGGGYGTAGAVGVCDGSWYSCGGTAAQGGGVYGSLTLRPILGGSGGGGGYNASSPGAGGGGGGGALVIASSGTLTVTGSLLANGGSGGSGYGGSGGSGGAIRLIAPTLTGAGTVRAVGGTYTAFGGLGGNGRIRLEAATLTLTGSVSPPPSTAYPLAVFPAAGQPTLAIASVVGVAVPGSPAGSFLAAPDILLPPGTTNPITISLIASNIPLGTTIQVTTTPQAGSATSALSTGLSGTLASSAATASLAVSLSRPSILTATATYPLMADAGTGPLYADGEAITHVRVAAVLGGGSRLTYLTRSGREVAVQ